MLVFLALVMMILDSTICAVCCNVAWHCCLWGQRVEWYSTPKSDNGMLTVCMLMQDNCAKLGLQPLEAFIGKIIQLYEMIVVRHGLMLVGQSYGMKTASHKVLAAALSDLYEKVHPPKTRVKNLLALLCAAPISV